MMILLLLALACQDSIESLVQDLGHDYLEVRERAQRRLIEIGEPALPALAAAEGSGDAEVRVRVQAIMEIAGRVPRERAHDADQKAAMILLRRNLDAERRPGSGATEGARFDLNATRFDDGWIISTQATDYLARHGLQEPDKGQLHFDIRGIAGADARELTVERCGRCSPAKVFVKAAEGPFTMRIVGNQVWFSPYHIEFQNPTDGRKKRIGDFTIQIAWPALQVESEREFPESWLSSMGNFFETTLKEGIEPLRLNSCGGTIRCGGRANLRTKEKRHWCDCPNGPQPAPSPTPTVRISGFSARRDSRDDRVSITFPEADELELPLEYVSKINHTFWKPIEIPIDLTVTVPAK